MKKLLNDPRHVVREMLEGQVALHPNQALLAREDVVIRADTPPFAQRREVAIISGGGAGHEPAHAGYVGLGMLHAAVAGDVFTSPSADAVLAAIRAVAGPEGALLVVKNYTGDRLNFGLAAELARTLGIPTEIVVVADDVALRETVDPERRRGIAGTVLVHKVAGSAAQAGLSLEEVAAEANAAADAVGTMGVALGPCTVPGAGRPGFTIADDEAELGLGIHGERGVRSARLAPADPLVDTILTTIIDDRALRPGERVALLVNGLGGTPPMELAIVARAALRLLRRRGLVVARAWCGNMLTALEMPGCSLSLMRLDDRRLARLSTSTEAPAWPGHGTIGEHLRLVDTLQAETAPPAITQAATPEGAQLRAAVLAAANALDAAVPHLTALDAQAGDGDLGASLARGAAALRALPDTAWTDPATALAAMAATLRRAIAGSSGPFYATALLRAARRLQDTRAPTITAPTLQDWAEAFDHAVTAISDLGGAKPGDRTMLDALRPAADALLDAARAARPAHAALSEAVAAAARGTDATATMVPRLGRASYLGARALGVPDAGATAVLIWLRAIAARD